MSKALFDDGIRYFLQTVALGKKEILSACKRKYPDIQGRGVNFVFVEPSSLGKTWRWGFVVDPGRYHMSKDRITEAVDGLSQDIIQLLEMQIDQYNAEKELLFCFICSGNGSSLISVDIV
jgi:hypothetical protein